MFLGPLRWPQPWMWGAAAVLAVVSIGLAFLGTVGQILVVVIVVAILVIAAPRRIKELDADEMRETRPDE